MVDAHQLKLKGGKPTSTPAPPTPAKAKVFDPWAGMNLTEQRYVLERLEPGRALGEIQKWEFEPFTFHLVTKADKMDYNPDFMVITSDGRIEFHEIKGKQIWEDSLIKFKMAMELYPYFYWYMWQWADNKWKLKKTNDAETRKANIKARRDSRLDAKLSGGKP